MRLTNPLSRARLSASIVLLLVAATHGCTTDSNGTALPAGSVPVPVTVSTAVRRDVPVQIPAIGNVEPFSTVTIRPQIDGQLADVHFQEGQWVTHGDLLFTIDPRPFEATLKQAEATQRRDAAELQNADVDAARKARLAAQGFVSAEENDAAQTRVASLRAAVRAGDATIENARLQLQYSSIRAPIDGRIGQILIHAGNIVKKNETTLTVINQLRPTYVAFAVREQDLVEIRRRAAAGPLTVKAFASKDDTNPAVGELAFVNNTVDSSTGTVLLKALFPNQDEQLWPGQYVNVQLAVREAKDAVVVPAAAVLTGQHGKYVFVVKPDSTVEIRPVTVDLDLGSELTIASGLSGGEQVVTDGQIRLAAGSKVDVKLAEPGGPSTAKAPQ